LIHLPRDRRASFFLLLFLTVLVLLGMLYFGIRRRGPRPDNHVRWSDAGAGLIFDRFAQAYTEGFFSDEHPGAGLTIEMAIQPELPKYLSFRFLLLVHDGRDAHQLVIGQWRSSLMVMNGDDYSNNRRRPKIYFQLDGNDSLPHLLTVVSNPAGTRLFLDGVLKKKNAELVLQYPGQGQQAKLVLGNSLNGNNPWVGTILGLACYDRDLPDDAVQRHYRRWRAMPDFSVFRADSPRLLYAFDEGRGERVYNKIAGGPDLIVPAWMQVLQFKVLSWPRFENLANASMLEDVLANLIGFVPFGFLLLATLGRLEGIGARSGLTAVFLFAFAFSLCIEIAQAWIPSRDSSLLDLILNTLGGGVGGVSFLWMHKRAGGKSG
jgi:VanZ family protein